MSITKLLSLSSKSTLQLSVVILGWGLHPLQISFASCSQLGSASGGTGGRLEGWRKKTGWLVVLV